jgi:hypothetical protein
MRQSLLVLAVLLSACGSVSIEIPSDIGADFDIDQVLDEVRDCDAMSATFLEVVSAAADQVDRLAEAANGRVEPMELREKVEAISVSEYFALAERIGCQRLELQVQTIDQLRKLDPEGAAGQELIDVILEQVEQQR